MEVRYLPNQDSYQRMNTDELRGAFVLDRLFVPGSISMVYCDADRAIVGGGVPATEPLALQASRKEMAAEYFAERREIGIVNIGGKGTVRVDGRDYPLLAKDMLYVGRGSKQVELVSGQPKDPAVFYFVSFPAHASHPVALARFADAERSTLGSTEAANRRTINKAIHGGSIKSCQLAMGLTELESGSVWNSMPPHTHQRRMEVYLYYGLPPESIVVHMMGKPQEVRSLILRNQQAVISPSWSIHCGAGTQNYSFVWAMGGENQEFSDMDPVAMTEFR